MSIRVKKRGQVDLATRGSGARKEHWKRKGRGSGEGGREVHFVLSSYCIGRLERGIGSPMHFGTIRTSKDGSGDTSRALATRGRRLATREEGTGVCSKQWGWGSLACI